MNATVVKLPAFLLVLLLLAACAAPPTPAQTQTIPAEPTELVRTVVPDLGPTADCAYPGGPGSLICTTPGAGTPAPSTTTEPAPPVTGYPAPGAGSPSGSGTATGSVSGSTAATATAAFLAEPTSPQPQPTVTAVSAQPIPYGDCSRTPGLPGCIQEDMLTEHIAARLAFVDDLAPRIIGLDLGSGDGWQAPVSGGSVWMEWSPDGSQLLAGLPGDLYIVYSAEGVHLETFFSPRAPNWQPDGQLSLDGSVRMQNGWRATLVRARETRWDLHFKRDSETERILPLDSLPADAFYVLRAWVPGTQKVLLQSYSAGGGALLGGGQLIAADTLAATLTSYEISAPLDPSAFAFNPTRGPQLALITSALGVPEAGGPEAAGGMRLALLDFDTNQVRYPLPEGVLPTGLAWLPDGSRLAFSAGPLAPNASDEARQAVPAPGIYLLDPQTGEVTALVQSAAPAVDGWPHFTADGQILLYARILPQQDGTQGTEIRARHLPTGQDWLLVQGLPAPPTAAGRPAWNWVIALGKK